jgi:VCBS repeat-containing protein
MVITELDASYSSEIDVVNGNFTLSQYALSGEGRNNVTYLEPNKSQGTTNVFKQATGSYGAETKEETADFFIALNNPDADMDAVIIGQSNDVTKSTYLTSDKNALQEVKITFEGENGEYYAVYSIGDEVYDEDGVAFTKNGKILLQIISSENNDKADKVAANLYIINNTDTTVLYEILNEDSDSPRVNIKGKTGDVSTN